MHGGASRGTRRQLRADPRSRRCLRLGGAPAAHVIARLRAGRSRRAAPARRGRSARGSPCRAGPGRAGPGRAGRGAPRPAGTPCGRRAGVAQLSRGAGGPLVTEPQHTLSWKGQGTHMDHRVQLSALHSTIPKSHFAVWKTHTNMLQ
ncbi:serine/arginine repetitive matrix protein 2-like [Passer domesticus]|uniref:serine/arginine repetitive matrix protein 2-like n=1 Tax=Passer domesticus TaxID=48849 RepID=UPI0030FE6BC9